MTDTRADPANNPYRLRLAALSLAMLLPSLGTSIANVALPTLAAAFQAPMANVQWVVISYLLAVTTLIVGAGRLGDLLGRRRILLFGIGLFAVASACGALAQNLWLLVALRGVQGLGAAIMMALTIASVRDMVPKDRTGSAMGVDFHPEVTRVFHRELTRLKIMFCGLCWGQDMRDLPFRFGYC